MSRLRTLLVAALMLLPLSLLAAPVAAPSAFDRFMALATGAGKTTVTLGSDGTPLAAPGVPTLQTDGGMPKATATGSLKNPAGNPVAVAASGRVKALAVSGAIGRFIGKAAPVGYWIGVAGAGYTLAKELGFKFGTAPDGSDIVEKADPNVCSVAPCYSYNGYSTPQLAGQALLGKAVSGLGCVNGSSPFSTYNKSYVGYNSSTNQVEVTRFYCNDSFQFANVFYTVTLGTVAPSPAVWTPATQQQFLDSVAAKSGWPSTSAISQVLADSAAASGVKLQIDPLTVTGPATSPGAQTVTQNTTNNTTKTETTTYNHTYNGDTVTTTAVTVTNITNNITGDTISSETKTETPEKEEDPPKEVATDTPLPEQPKLYTPKYPQGLEGVWTQQKANLTSTPLANLVGRLMPNVGSSGICPTMNIDLSLAAWADFGVMDVAPPCYVWDWGRIIILVSALLLARALIFGG